MVPLLMVVFGIIHFGVLLAQQASLNNAVRTGARYGSVNLYNSVANPHTCTNVVNQTKDSVSTLGMAPSAVTIKVFRGADAAATSGTPLCTNGASSITPPCQGSSQTDNLYVQASFSTDLVGIPFTGITKTISVQSVGVYRCEYS